MFLCSFMEVIIAEVFPLTLNKINNNTPNTPQPHQNPKVLYNFIKFKLNMVIETSPNQTGGKTSETPKPFIKDENVLVLESPPIKKTEEELEEEKISQRKAVANEITQAVKEHKSDNKKLSKLIEKITNKAIENGLFTERQMKGRLEEIGHSIGYETYTDWRLTSKESFKNKADNEVIEEAYDFFMVGDILVTPTRVHAGEVKEDQTPNFKPAHQRGVIRAIQKATMIPLGNEEKLDRTIKDLYDKAVFKYGIFQKYELDAMIEEIQDALKS